MSTLAIAAAVSGCGSPLPPPPAEPAADGACSSPVCRLLSYRTLPAITKLPDPRGERIQCGPAATGNDCEPLYWCRTTLYDDTRSDVTATTDTLWVGRNVRRIHRIADRSRTFNYAQAHRASARRMPGGVARIALQRTLRRGDHVETAAQCEVRSIDACEARVGFACNGSDVRRQFADRPSPAGAAAYIFESDLDDRPALIGLFGTAISALERADGEALSTPHVLFDTPAETASSAP